MIKQSNKKELDLWKLQTILPRPWMVPKKRLSLMKRLGMMKSILVKATKLSS